MTLPIKVDMSKLIVIKHSEVVMSEEKDEVFTEESASTIEENETVNTEVAAEPTVAELQAEIASMQDQYLRKVAEHDNFRRRLLKDKEDAIKYANGKLLEDLIEIIDNFDRALTSGKSNKDFDLFYDGISMIEGQMLSMLDTKYGLKKMDCKGQDFDPEIHEAVAILPAPEGSDLKGQMVMDEVLKGYTLGDRVLRHAKVVVTKETEEN